MRKKEIEEKNQKFYQRLAEDYSSINLDYFGGISSVGFKFRTSNDISDLKSDNKSKTLQIDELFRRIQELENIIIKSGIVEELDTTDIVNLPNNDPWSLSDKSKYVVNKVKI